MYEANDLNTQSEAAFREKSHFWYYVVTWSMISVLPAARRKATAPFHALIFSPHSSEKNTKRRWHRTPQRRQPILRNFIHFSHILDCILSCFALVTLKVKLGSHGDERVESFLFNEYICCFCCRWDIGSMLTGTISKMKNSLNFRARSRRQMTFGNASLHGNQNFKFMFES